jgi:hypothetical protein
LWMVAFFVGLIPLINIKYDHHDEVRGYEVLFHLLCVCIVFNIVLIF